MKLKQSVPNSAHEEPMLKATNTGIRELTQPAWLVNFCDIYQQLNTKNLLMIKDIYSVDIEFSDPMHTIKGLDHLLQYFDQLYTNLQSCSFVIDNAIHNENSAAIYWTMEFVHPQLNRGRVVIVEGSSLLKAKDGKVCFHRDYLDVGAMLYEHVPVVGRIIKAIKSRAVT